MKKAMMYIGITVVSVAAFFAAAFAINALCELVYYNTSLLDAFYYNEWFTYMQVGITAIVMNGVFTELRDECEIDEDCE